MSNKPQDGRLPSGLLTEAAGADYLGVSVSTLRDWRCRRKEHHPPFVRLGGKVYFRQVDLDDHIASRVQRIAQ